MNDNEIRRKIENVLEMIEKSGWKHKKPVFTKESIVAIKELAEDCRKTKLFKQNEKTVPEWIKTGYPEELYIHMCIKIANAPTQLHLISAPILMIPYIADALEREVAG